MNEIILRDYQQNAVDSLRSCYSGGARAPLLVLPTGAGKTVCFCYITKNAAMRKNKTIILVHRRELLRQTSESLTKLGVDHGRIASGHLMDFTKDTQVASVQTLAQRFVALSKANWKPDLIIIDEAHHATAGSWRAVVGRYPNARILGVTATPCRMDGSGLSARAGGIFDEMVIGPQISELIRRGFLAPPEIFAPPLKFDRDALPTRSGDFQRGAAEAVMCGKSVVGDAVEHYSTICPGVPAIAFCVSVKHAEFVAEEFRNAGWISYALDGSMDAGKRADLINRLGRGEIHVLTSCDIISEGTDIPIVGAAILLRATKSLGLYLQQVGRALRLYDGKEKAIILDHVGNSHTHGWPDDDQEWSLKMKPTNKRGKEKLPPPPKTCGKCFLQYRMPPPKKCPHCKHPLPQAPQMDRMDSLEHSDGKLVKITEDDRKEIARKRKKEQQRASTLDDFVALAIQRGYSNPMVWAQKAFAKKAYGNV